MRIHNLWFHIALPHFVHQIYIKNIRLRAAETYSHNEMDPIALSGVSDFVAHCEIGEMAKRRVGALGKTA